MGVQDKYGDIWAALAAPFRTEMIATRFDGRHYISARAAMTRLDEVLGPHRWTADYTAWNNNAVRCVITITMPDGETFTKTDIGANSTMVEKNQAQGKPIDPGEDDKGGISDSLKRAAQALGVGRHLYDDGWTVPVYPTTSAYVHPHSAEPLDRVRSGMAPEPAPQRQPAPDPRQEVRQAFTPQNGNGNAPPADDRPRGGTPRTGRALFAWVKDREKDGFPDLLGHLNTWAAANHFPSRMVDFSADQTAAAVTEASDYMSMVAR